jgi:elongation factor G
VALVVPLLDADGNFAGLGDALTGAVQWFTGRPDATLIPSLQAMLGAAHERVVEVAADCDPAVMASVVAGEAVAPERLRAALRGAFLAGELVPVLAGAALYNRGVDWLLDAVVGFFPSVSDLPARGVWSVAGAGSPVGAFCGFVFKVQHFDQVWNYVRVVRGRVVAGAAVIRGQRPQSGSSVVSELWLMKADRHDVVASAGPGEVVVVPGDLGWRTGDTVCDASDPVVLVSPKFPAPVLAVTFEPELAEQGGQIYAAVRELAIDDPTLRVARDYDRIVVRGMGELHLEIVADLARLRAAVAFRVSKPRVDRRETIARPATAMAEAHTVIGGIEQVACCEVSVAPVAGGNPAVLRVATEGVMVPVAVAELQTRLVAGSRVGSLHGMELVVTQVSGTTTTEALVEQAAAKAFATAIAAAELVELEPWVAFEVLAPAASSAAVLADLGARGGEVSNLAAGRLGSRLTGRAPLARMLGYVTRLRSITKGLGQVVIRPDGFAPAR